MAWSKRYIAETITGVDYTVDLAHLLNTPAQTEFLLYSEEQVARDNGLYNNSEDTGFMFFK